MTKQLRLVETSLAMTRPTHAKTKKRSPAKRRTARVYTSWPLNDHTRQVGQLGVAAARRALAQSETKPQSSEPQRRAS